MMATTANPKPCPTVIDERLLADRVSASDSGDDVTTISVAEVDLGEIKSLRIDYKNILKIDNLGALVNLTKLQLDNNIIERIENLDLLVNLQWLDLSFNNIEYIEGLDKLTKLTDLTLFNNQIKKIENMDKLEKLHVLSLGNNEIENPEEVVYLRRFKHLKSLNLKGNSMCKQKDHQAFVVAHLENVTFFNFRLIDEGMRKQALEKYADAISELERGERQEASAHADELRLQEETDTFLKANIVGFGGGRIFDEMYGEDTELPKLQILKGHDELVEEQRGQVVDICQEITKTALHHMEILSEEKTQFKLCVDEAKEDATAKSVAIRQLGGGARCTFDKNSRGTAQRTYLPRRGRGEDDHRRGKCFDAHRKRDL